MTWTTKNFGECAELIRETIIPDQNLDLNYIGLEHISQGGLSLLEVGISSDVMSQKSVFKKGDILFGKLRPYFRKLIIAPFDGICSTDIWVVRAKPEIDQRFLFYWMATQEFVDNSSQASEGTKMPRAIWEFVSRFEKEIPPLPEQRAIADVLSALDDKIELNRRMNSTLEQLAQAIFKHYFFNYPEYKSWPFVPIGDMIKKIVIPVTPTPLLDNEKYISLDDMPSKSIGLANYRSGKEVNSSIYRFQKEDILFGAMRPYFHKVGIAPFDGITRSTTFVIRPNKDFYLSYVLFRMFRDDFIEYCTSSSVGSTIPYVQWDTFIQYPINMPPVGLLQRYHSIVYPLLQKIINNGKENHILSELRDTLLPKLMSGQVRVNPTVTMALDASSSVASGERHEAIS